MIVIKFGGTSVGSAERVANAVDIVAGLRDRRPVVVVSALAGVTNDLVKATALAAEGRLAEVQDIVAAIRERHESVAMELVKQKGDFLESFLAQLRRHTDQILDILKGIALVGDVSLRAKDKIVAIGEKLSSVLFSYSLRMRTLPGVHVDSEEVIVTNDRFGEASPLMDQTRDCARRVLLPEIERNHIPVMGGFFGRSSTGGTTTLGRGGSDYSAAIVGAAIEADEIQIWTDVDGMMTCDPRLIPSARIIDRISYVEAAELAYFGAKVLHPKTIAPAVDLRIPIRVLNTHNLGSAGTLITAEGTEATGPRAIAMKTGITVVDVSASQMLGAHGFLERIFHVFARLQLSVDLVTTSEVSVSVTIDGKQSVDEIRDLLTQVARDTRSDDMHVTSSHEMTIIAVVGKQLLAGRAGAKIFAALDGFDVRMISLGTSNLNLSVVIPDAQAGDAIRALHAALFEESMEGAA